MITPTLEQVSKATAQYTAARDRSCRLKSDARMATWLTSHKEFVDPVQRISDALVKAFKEQGGYVSIVVQKDPENGDESIVFEVNTKMEGTDARRLMDGFLDDHLSEIAGDLEDYMVFSVNPIGAAKD